MFFCIKKPKIVPSNHINIEKKLGFFYNELTIMEKGNSQYNSSLLLNIQSILDCISLVYEQKYIKNNYTYNDFKYLIGWIEQYESNNIKELSLKKEIQYFCYNIMKSNDIEHVLILNNKLKQNMNKNKRFHINCSFT